MKNLKKLIILLACLAFVYRLGATFGNRETENVTTLSVYSEGAMVYQIKGNIDVTKSGDSYQIKSDKALLTITPLGDSVVTVETHETETPLLSAIVWQDEKRATDSVLAIK